MGLTFEWNNHKAKSNFANHGITFEEAATVFGDPLAITFEDMHHSSNELREITIGYSSEARLILVVHTERLNAIRIIFARKATKKERKYYENKE